jgi:hypothetical protein
VMAGSVVEETAGSEPQSPLQEMVSEPVRVKKRMLTIRRKKSTLSEISLNNHETGAESPVDDSTRRVMVARKVHPGETVTLENNEKLTIPAAEGGGQSSTQLAMLGKKKKKNSVYSFLGGSKVKDALLNKEADERIEAAAMEEKVMQMASPSTKEQLPATIRMGLNEEDENLASELYALKVDTYVQLKGQLESLKAAQHKEWQAKRERLKALRIFERTEEMREEKALMRWNKQLEDWNAQVKMLQAKVGRHPQALSTVSLPADQINPETLMKAKAMRGKQQAVDPSLSVSANNMKEIIDHYVPQGYVSADFEVEGTEPLPVAVEDSKGLVVKGKSLASMRALNTLVHSQVFQDDRELLRTLQKTKDLGRTSSMEQISTLGGGDEQGGSRMKSALRSAGSRQSARSHQTVTVSEDNELVTGGYMSGPCASIAPKSLLAEASVGDIASMQVEITNTGSTALYFAWREEVLVPLVSPAVENSHVPFFFDAPKGVLLPDATATFTFIFQASNPGIYLQRWTCDTTPPLAEPLTVGLRGVAFVEGVDENALESLEQHIEANCVKHMAQEVLVDVCRGVRTPSPEPPSLNPEEELKLNWMDANPDSKLFFSTQLIEACQQLASELFTFLEIPEDEQQWDLSLAGLQEMIESIEDESTRADWDNRLNSTVKIGDFPPMLPERSILRSVTHQAILDIVDALPDIAAELRPEDEEEKEASRFPASGALERSIEFSSKVIAGEIGSLPEDIELTPEEIAAKKEEYHQVLLLQMHNVVSDSLDRWLDLTGVMDNWADLYESVTGNRMLISTPRPDPEREDEEDDDGNEEENAEEEAETA